MNTNSMPVQSVRSRRACSALQMLFVGDALSMPVHWFYRPMDIWHAFPPKGIRKMEAAPKRHPGSIMSLHSTTQGGRTASASRARGHVAQQIVGEVILKGKEQYWNQRQVHYHQGLPAGENTLNTWCARLLMNWLTQRALAGTEPLYDVEAWLTHYIEFMTADTPQHPDTYAESYHRGFFANLAAGKPLDRCGAVTHDTPSMGALVTLAPLAFALLKQLPLAEVQSTCRQHVWSTHPDETLMKVVDAYVKLMDQLLHAEDANDATIVAWLCDAAAVVEGGNISRCCEQPIENSGASADGILMKLLTQDMTIVGGRFSLACYITDSWPSVCYLAARHFKNPKRALLINSNLGGENAHRGSVLGTLLGLANGTAVDELYNSLHREKAISQDIQQYAEAL